MYRILFYAILFYSVLFYSRYVTGIRAHGMGEVQVAYGSGDCLARVATIPLATWLEVPEDTRLTAPAKMRDELRAFLSETGEP